MIPRNAEKTLRKLVSQYPVVVCTGARQTGKTTLLKELFPQYTYVSLDLPSTAAMAEETPDAFFKKYPAPVVIDEVQYAPSLFRYVKSRVDSDRLTPGQYILTGSQKFVLMNSISESLAGRAAVFELPTLCLEEALAVPSYSVQLFMTRGGYPELARQYDMTEESYFYSYVSTYLERDVRELINVSNLRNFERFIRLLAVRNAQQLEMNSLASSLGVTGKTVSSWLSVLETSGIVSLLEPWFGNVGKRIVKTPKIYFCDTGLLCWLLGVTKQSLSTSPFLGPVQETFVFNELDKTIKNSQMNRRLYYYRDSNGLEVDFIILGEGCRCAEVKSTQNPKSDDVKNIAKLYDLAQKSNNPELAGIKSYCVCAADDSFTLHTAQSGTDVSVVSFRDTAKIL
jgi:predicted AAA+ superfamily ATPase